MTINGIPGSIILPAGLNGANAARSSRTEQQRPAVPVPASPALPPAVAGNERDLPVQAPPGTDPELWNVLTAEERTFFAKVGAMGPLTYGRVLSGQLPSPAQSLRGGRVNVKV